MKPIRSSCTAWKLNIVSLRAVFALYCAMYDNLNFTERLMHGIKQLKHILVNKCSQVPTEPTEDQIQKMETLVKVASSEYNQLALVPKTLLIVVIFLFCFRVEDCR